MYLLQLEEYDTLRYLNLLKRNFLRRNLEKRSKLEMTSRAKTTMALSIAISFIFFVPLLFFTFMLVPLHIALANIILTPVYELIKKRLQKKASIYFSNNFKGKVIAIAGSFGKTTTKNYIYELIRFNYKTQMIPGNINTPTGIAQWVLRRLDKNAEILIVEMDTYYIGEIKKSCAITPPDIAILTNIGDQHLERFGKKSNLKIALEEIFDYAKKDAKMIKGKKSNLEYALEVAKVLNIPKDIVRDTIKKLKKPDRRGDMKILYGFTAIDESYNISFTTARYGLNNASVVAKKQQRKLIVITGGIPELGPENKHANYEYGNLLAKSNADVVLLQTVFYDELVRGLRKTPSYTATSMEQAWAVVKDKYDPNKYIVLMQPELSDSYY